MHKNIQNKKIAIVCDWIKDWWGAEVVLEQLLEIFPQADIFTSVFWQQWNKIFEGRQITTSFIQKIPILNKSHKMALGLRPLAFESFDLSWYDIVISSTSAESKWIITKPETLQICYCHTPTRYFWSHYHEYLQMMEFWWILNWFAKKIAPYTIHKLRKWDFCASIRPDYFIANSQNTQARISKYYKRDSEVIYPCLDVENIDFCEEKSDYYFYNWRCIPYKKFDLIVDAFNENGKKIIIATNTDNKLFRELKRKSKDNIEWRFTWDIDEINRLHSQAKAFLFPPEEDFWLVPIAAMATWTPVIAYGKWWALETVVAWKTGIFFEKQTPASLNTAINDFERLSFSSKEIRQHAEQFDKKIFQKNFLKFIEKKLKDQA
jgi:glycosyltransferase involved in cell wall biosynthesis